MELRGCTLVHTWLMKNRGGTWSSETEHRVSKALREEKMGWKAYFIRLNVLKTLSKGDSKACCILLILTSCGRGHTEDEGVEWRGPRRLATKDETPLSGCVFGPSQSLKEEGALWGEVIVGKLVNVKPLCLEDLREKVTAGELLREKVDFYIAWKEWSPSNSVHLGCGWGRPCMGAGVPVHHQSLDPRIPPTWGLSCQQDDPQGPGRAVATEARSPSSMGLISGSQYHPVLPEPSTCLLFPCSPSYFD